MAAVVIQLRPDQRGGTKAIVHADCPLVEVATALVAEGLDPTSREFQEQLRSVDEATHRGGGRRMWSGWRAPRPPDDIVQ